MKKILIIIAALLCTSLPGVAVSQARITDQLALARVAASEAGLLATDDEIAAIAAVLRESCSECSLLTSARNYSGRVFDPTRNDPRAWVAFLSPDGREPAHWPEGVSWSVHRERWLAVYEAAGRVVRGDLVHRCPESPRHWGGAMDRERAARMRLVQIDCGDTRNDFYVLPSRSR